MKDLYFLVLCMTGFISGMIKVDAQVLVNPFQNRMIQNPSMIGSDGGGVRVGFRSDWTKIPGNYTTNYGVLGIQQKQHNFGAIWSSESAGITPFKKQQISLVYAYAINVAEETQLKLGISAGLSSYRFGGGTFIFADQVDINRGIIAETGEQFDQEQREAIPQIHIGVNYQDKNWWVGAAYQTYFGGITFLNKSVSIPTVLQVNGGCQLVLTTVEEKNNTSSILLYPEISFLSVGGFVNTAIGGNVVFDHFSGQNGLFFIGSFYRRAISSLAHSGLILNVGLEQQKMRFSYNYTIGLQQFIGGGHEFTATLFFGKRERNLTPYF